MSANTYYFFVTIYYKILRFINWVESTIRMAKIFFKTFSFKKEDYYEQDKSSKRGHYYEREHQKFYEEKEQGYTKQEEPKRETKREYGKYERFYSSSAYVVLGVNAEDDLEAIKKVYRKLVREYHPDLNPENIELYTEITQNINNAWDKVKSWKK